MKEHKFPDQSFIRGYYINPKICDDIIKCFNELPEAYRKPGEIYVLSFIKFFLVIGGCVIHLIFFIKNTRVNLSCVTS